MRRNRSSAVADPSVPPQRLHSLRSSSRRLPLSSSSSIASALSRPSSTLIPRKQDKKPRRNLRRDVTVLSSSDSDSDTHDEQEHRDAGHLTEYERQRLEKIQRNLAFMQQMGVSTAKLAARTAIDARASGSTSGSSSNRTTTTTTSALLEAKRQQRAAVRAMQAARKAERLSQPVRKSRRLEGKQVEVQPIESIDQFEMNQMRSSSHRLSRGSSSSSNMPVIDAVDDSDSRAFLKTFIIAESEDEAVANDTLCSEDDSDEDKDGDDEYRVTYSLADGDIVKAVQTRIYSVAFLPRADRVVVACGDKMGHVALWTPVAAAKGTQESSVSPLAVYRPHDTPVSQLIFSDSSTLLSSSFDGTVREFDLRAATSSVVYDTSDDAAISSLVTASMAQCYYASCDDGTVRLIDRRARNVQSSRYQLHEKKINTVHQHPSVEFCIATASLDRTVCLWDARKMTSERNVPLVILPHYRSVNCAYFSPRDGAWLVTVGQDSFIDMFDTSSLTKHKLADKPTIALPKPIRVRHNNLTGRWLTKFHAAWDPKRPKHFVLGCLDQPRRIQIFRAGRRRPVRELISDNFASVHSMNAFHPHLELIAGGNSSGRLALWRGKKVDENDDVKADVKSQVGVKTE